MGMCSSGGVVKSYKDDSHVICRKRPDKDIGECNRRLARTRTTRHIRKLICPYSEEENLPV